MTLLRHTLLKHNHGSHRVGTLSIGNIVALNPAWHSRQAQQVTKLTQAGNGALLSIQPLQAHLIQLLARILLSHFHQRSLLTTARHLNINPELRPYLEKYLHTRPGVSVEDRMRLYSLVRDSTADAYGGWELVTTVQAGGGLAAQRIVVQRSYDMEAAKHYAKVEAGIIKE